MPDRLIVRALERLMEIPHLNCGQYPTPLVELRRLRNHLGRGPRLFIKHDDSTGPVFGGNKVRKLEYVLAQALADQAEVVITIGSEQSNHARITATLGARLGLRTILVLNPAASGHAEEKPASLLVDELFGAETHFVRTREERIPTMQRIANELRFAGKRVVEIPLGASVPLGALGYVRAVQEVVEQMGDEAFRLSHMFNASSSGGTQAGIAVGCRLAGLRARVIGVSPDDASSLITSEVKNIIAGVEALLEMTGEPPEVEVLDDYIGPGYGVPSQESERALQLLARVEGILLDPVYTAKAMAGLLAWIEDGRLSKSDSVLFWHTGGQLALFEASKRT
jgi:D-cysteine desulfhydrase family pyridoxal phosphate-dependent enzyme